MTATSERQAPRRVTVYEPLSMITAEPGWRACYAGQPGQAAEPLIGWGIFDVTEKPAAGQTGPTHHYGRQVHGIVAAGPGAEPALEAGEFRCYLAPGEPLPPEPEDSTNARERSDDEDHASAGPAG